jgi:putative RecB family exonuclease
MALHLPSSLSPSKVASFTECALAFRFSAIDRLPDPPTVATVRGTLVHAALERLFLLEPHERTPDAGQACLAEARTELATDPEAIELGLDPAGEDALAADASVLVGRYFELEDPTAIRPIGLELKLETDIEGLRVRGIIDRLELDADGELIVTDYKSGRAPGERYEQSRLGGVHFYAFLCERVLGRRPAAVQLLYLGDGVTIRTEPSDQSIRALERKVRAIWSAIERACERDDFRPRTSRLCDYCAYQAWCPAFGGDPEGARREAERLAAAALDEVAVATDGTAVAVPVASPA